MTVPLELKGWRPWARDVLRPYRGWDVRMEPGDAGVPPAEWVDGRPVIVLALTAPGFGRVRADGVTENRVGPPRTARVRIDFGRRTAELLSPQEDPPCPANPAPPA